MQRTLFLMPVKNDYKSAEKLITQIKTLSERGGVSCQFLLVDDGSHLEEFAYISKRFGRGNKVKILKLNQRTGHQNAIFVGLQHASSKYSNFNVVIMDADGEDKPEDAVTIAKLLENEQIVMAKRGSRESSFAFKIGYFLYLKLFKRLVGIEFKSGNFIGISSSYIPTILTIPTLRKHVAASIMRRGVNIKYLEFDRAPRIDGSSQMNFAGLVLHAYGAFSVFSDTILVRLCFFFFGIVSLLIPVVSLLGILKLTGELNAIPGWTSIIFVQLLAMLLNLFAVSIIGLLLLLRIESVN
jgi:hypothetical protein